MDIKASPKGILMIIVINLYLLLMILSLIGFIQNHQEIVQNGCSRHHKGVSDANLLRVELVFLFTVHIYSVIIFVVYIDFISNYVGHFNSCRLAATKIVSNHNAF